MLNNSGKPAGGLGSGRIAPRRIHQAFRARVSGDEGPLEVKQAKIRLKSGFTRAAGAQVKSAPAAAVSAQVQPAPYTDTHDLEDILKAMQVSAMINLVDLMDLSDFIRIPSGFKYTSTTMTFEYADRHYSLSTVLSVYVNGFSDDRFDSLMRVLARLALLPRAGVQVCRAFDIEDFVCVDHRMGLGKKMFCRALLKLRAVGHALAPDAPYPAVTEEEAVDAPKREHELVTNLAKIALQARLGLKAAAEILDGDADRIKEKLEQKLIPQDRKLCDFFVRCLACTPAERMSAVDFTSHPVFSMGDPTTFSNLCIALGEILKDSGGDGKEQAAKITLREGLHSIPDQDNPLSDHERSTGRLGGEGSFVNQILQTHGIKNPQPSKGYAKRKWEDELPVALTYDLHDVPDICHMFRCLHKHSSKAAVDELKPIMAELAELPGNKMVQMITRMLLPRFMKDGPGAPIGPLGWWEVPIKGEVQDKQAMLELAVYHVLRLCWPRIKPFQDELQPYVKSCAGGKVSPWFSGAPASRLTAPAIEFKDAMVSYKKACNNYKQDPAASPTAKAGSLDAAGSSSKAATSTGKAAVEPSTAQSAQGSAAAPTTGQICRPSSSPVLTVVRGTAPTGVTAGPLLTKEEAEKLPVIMGSSLLSPSLRSMRTLFAQRMSLLRKSMLAAGIRAVLTLDKKRVGRAFIIGQMETLLMACLMQYYTGPLLLQLLEASITLLMEPPEEQQPPGGQHPRKLPQTEGLTNLATVMELVQCLLAHPGLLEGTPAATLDSLQASAIWWAYFKKEARTAACKITLTVPDGAAAAAKAFYVADTTGESSAALQAFVKNDYLTKTRWIMSSKIETLQKSSLKAAAVAKEEAAAAKGGAAARDAAAGKLTVAQGLSTAAICSCSATPREYLASGPFAPDSLPREPMQPKNKTPEEFLDMLMTQIGYTREPCTNYFVDVNKPPPNPQAADFMKAPRESLEEGEIPPAEAATYSSDLGHHEQHDQESSEAAAGAAAKSGKSAAAAGCSNAAASTGGGKSAASAEGGKSAAPAVASKAAASTGGGKSAASAEGSKSAAPAVASKAAASTGGGKSAASAEGGKSAAPAVASKAAASTGGSQPLAMACGGKSAVSAVGGKTAASGVSGKSAASAGGVKPAVAAQGQPAAAAGTKSASASNKPTANKPASARTVGKENMQQSRPQQQPPLQQQPRPQGLAASKGRQQAQHRNASAQNPPLGQQNNAAASRLAAGAADAALAGQQKPSRPAAAGASAAGKHTSTQAAGQRSLQQQPKHPLLGVAPTLQQMQRHPAASAPAPPQVQNSLYSVGHSNASSQRRGQQAGRGQGRQQQQQAAKKKQVAAAAAAAPAAAAAAAAAAEDPDEEQRRVGAKWPRPGGGDAPDDARPTKRPGRTG